MKAKIFYFSGTGNSLYTAKEISKILGDCRIISIPAVKDEELLITEDTIGIIYPVYFQTIPANVKKFMKKLKFHSNPYIFSIATNNNAPGRANDYLNKILLSKHGKKLNAGYSLVMPGNSVIIANYTNCLEERNLRLEKAKDKILTIVESIKNKINNLIEQDRSLRWLLQGKITTAASRIYNVPKHFWTNEKCNKCGSCIKLCPEKNIRLVDEIKWGNKCLNCLACFHWCPKKAIELDSYSKERLRYHHPEINIKEMYL